MWSKNMAVSEQKTATLKRNTRGMEQYKKALRDRD
jgi:hypothetical protein